MLIKNSQMTFEDYMYKVGAYNLDFSSRELSNLRFIYDHANKVQDPLFWMDLHEKIEAKVSVNRFNHFRVQIQCDLSPVDYIIIKKLYLLTDAYALDGDLDCAKAYWHSLMIIIRSLDKSFIIKDLSSFDGAIPYDE